MQQDHVSAPQPEMLHVSEPVPALVNAALLRIAQAYIPQLRAIDADDFLGRMWTGDARLIYAPAADMPNNAAGSESGDDGEPKYNLALGTVAFGLPNEESTGDAYRVFLSVVPYSDEHVSIALETDAMAHAMGVHEAEGQEPARVYSLWFAAGAPEDMLGEPEIYVISPDSIEAAEELTEDPSCATTLIAYTDIWPLEEDDNEHAHRFWNLLDELAERLYISLSD